MICWMNMQKLKPESKDVRTENVSGSNTCKNCGKSAKCCTKVEPAFITRYDITRIRHSYPQIDDFIIEETLVNGQTFKTIASKDNGTCPFLKAGPRCEIYEFRPIDCQLFPLDIYKQNGRYFWIVYTPFCSLSSLMKAKVKAVERFLLSNFGKDELEAYAEYTSVTSHFKTGRWIKLCEVSINSNSNAQDALEKDKTPLAKIL